MYAWTGIICSMWIHSSSNVAMLQKCNWFKFNALCHSKFKWMSHDVWYPWMNGKSIQKKEASNLIWKHFISFVSRISSSLFSVKEDVFTLMKLLEKSRRILSFLNLMKSENTFYINWLSKRYIWKLFNKV